MENSLPEIYVLGFGAWVCQGSAYPENLFSKFDKNIFL